MKKYYVNIRDYQGGHWAYGFVGTIKEWKELAISWCESDENVELLRFIKNHKLDNDLLDFISEVWTIEIVELDKNIVNDIVYNYDNNNIKCLLNEIIKKLYKNGSVNNE